MKKASVNVAVPVASNDLVTSFLQFWDDFIHDIPKLKTAEETFYASLLGMEANYPKEYKYFKENRKKLLHDMAKLFQHEFKFPKELDVNSLNALKTVDKVRFDSTVKTEGDKLVKFLSSVLPGATVEAEDKKGLAYIVYLTNPAPATPEWIKAMNTKLYKTYPELDGLAGFTFIG